MKNIFRKYIHSACTPQEFNEVEQTIQRKTLPEDINKWLKDLWNESLSSEEKRTNPALWSKIKLNIDLAEGQEAQRKLKIYQIVSRVAAVFVIGLLIASFFVFNQSSDKLIASNYQTVSTPFGAKTQIYLPDGSEVWINAGSTLSYPAHFEKTRHVKLQGEAFFKVKKASSLFIVSTSYGEVKVTGTSFNVKAFDDDNAFETTLIEGSVAVKSARNTHELLLKPGQQAYLNGQELSIREVEPQHFTSWKEGKLIFIREPFPGFVRKLERWYNIHIEYKDSSLNDIWYTGTIEMETVSEIMEMINRAAPVHCSYNSTNRIFTISTK